MKMIAKFLLFIRVTQENSEGKRRINPFNPFSYLTILIVFLFMAVCYGIVGMWKEIDVDGNPFKFQ